MLLSGVGDRRKQLREMLGDRKNHLRGYFGVEIISPKSSSGIGKVLEKRRKERKREEKKKTDRSQKRNRRKRKSPKMYLVRAAGRSLLVEPRYRGLFDAANSTRLL